MQHKWGHMLMRLSYSQPESLNLSRNISSHPVGTRLAHRLLQALCLFPPICFIFPVAQIKESFLVLWCGLMAE